MQAPTRADYVRTCFALFKRFQRNTEARLKEKGKAGLLGCSPTHPEQAYADSLIPACGPRLRSEHHCQSQGLDDAAIEWFE